MELIVDGGGEKVKVLLREHRPQYVPDPFRSENFYYNKEEDYCVCPMGQHMTRTGTSHKKSASGYVSNRATYTAHICQGEDGICV